VGEAGRHRRNAVWLTAGDTATKLLGFVYFFAMNRQLTSVELATWALFLALFPVATVMTGLGLPDVVTREMAREGLARRPKLLRRAFALQCVCSGVLGIGAAAALPQTTEARALRPSAGG